LRAGLSTWSAASSSTILVCFKTHPLTLIRRVNPSGSMRNGEHEGYPGKRILEVRDHLNQNGYLDRKPNVVLMHIGTNNCIQSRDYVSGAEDLADFAGYLIDQIPGVAVIMSTLGPIYEGAANSRCQDTLNPGIRDQVTKLQDQGKNVHLVDFGAPGYISRSDIGDDDGVHPTEEGYGKYAELWYYAIQDMYRDGHINPAARTQYPDKSDDGGSSSNKCEKVAGKAFGPVDSQFGKAGSDDGPYSHVGRKWGSLIYQKTQKPIKANGDEDITQNLMFAQLINPKNPDRNRIQEDLIVYFSGNDDYAKKHKWNPNRANVRVAENLGNGVFGPEKLFSVDDGPGCLTRGVRWGDVNSTFLSLSLSARLSLTCSR
jgi:lysophospholipase L1-like esterase